MARQTIVQLTDDLDGTPAQLSVRFGWDGVEYEIDLHANNADAFAAAVRPYLAAARPISPPRRGDRSVAGRARRAPQSQRSSELATIRAWARQNGHQLADRGRIPTSILDAYQGSAGRDASPSAASTSSDSRRRSTRTATKTEAKRPGGRKTTAKKTTRKKTTAEKTTAPPSAAKTTAKRTTAKKSTATETTAKKTAAKKRIPRKSTGGKTAKAAAKKTAAKKTAAKTTVRRSRS